MLSSQAPSGDSPAQPPPTNPPVSKHYENFPVASLLCPAHLRAPILAIYAFARCADDIADEGDALPAQRLEDLAAMTADLINVSQKQTHSGRWSAVFDPLEAAICQFNLPIPLLNDLLDAFKQDIGKTRDLTGYSNHTELLEYCRLSANPIGRLLLHLYGIHDKTSLEMSDNICTALQLINFWQDLSQDLPRGRYYLPEMDCAQFQVTRKHLNAGMETAPVLSLIRLQVKRAKALMVTGAPLVKRIPGRAGWELRMVVQGGLRIIDKIERLKYATLSSRPKITAFDAPLMLWRAIWM
jgi:hydroxysqualene synthase